MIEASWNRRSSVSNKTFEDLLPQIKSFFVEGIYAIKKLTESNEGGLAEIYSLQKLVAKEFSV